MNLPWARQSVLTDGRVRSYLTTTIHLQTAREWERSALAFCSGCGNWWVQPARQAPAGSYDAIEESYGATRKQADAKGTSCA